MSDGLRVLATVSAAAMLMLSAGPARSDVIDVVVDARLPWIGFVNVFAVPTAPGTDRGDYVEGLFLGTDIAKVPAVFSAGALVVGPNDRVGGAPPGDPYWWQPDGQGGYQPNKVLESNVYVDEGFSGVDLSGQTVRFSGQTLSQSLPAGYTAYAWIRDFAPGYTVQRDQVIVPLVAGLPFEALMNTSGDGVVQYGLAVFGPNADPASLVPGQVVSVTAVPEPGTSAMWLAGTLALFGLTRRTRRA